MGTGPCSPGPRQYSRGQPGPVPSGGLEHVADARAGQDESARRDGEHPQEPVLAIEEDDVDREPHPEGVDRAAPPQQERVVGAQRRATEQPSRALAARRGLEEPDRAERGDPHAGTLPGAADAPGRRTAPGCAERAVGRAGFEPATRGLKAPCSNQAELPARWDIVGNRGAAYPG